jgi:Gnt-I system high-affinity gluconate transporter
MSILIVLACIVLLILCITAFKINAFLSFLIVSTVAALALGVSPSDVGKTLQQGVGDMLGSLVIVIIAGSMLGKLVAETGAAQQISSGLMKLFGERYLQVAFMITGFIIGIPLFYNVGFILVFPLIATVVYRYKLPAVYVGLPMVASLSVTHGFLPPHPSPVALVGQFNANMGLTLLYGMVIAIPTVILAGPVFSRSLKYLKPNLIQTFQSEGLPEDKLPSLFNSVAIGAYHHCRVLYHKRGCCLPTFGLHWRFIGSDVDLFVRGNHHAWSRSWVEDESHYGFLWISSERRCHDPAHYGWCRCIEASIDGQWREY